MLIRQLGKTALMVLASVLLVVIAWAQTATRNPPPDAQQKQGQSTQQNQLPGALPGAGQNAPLTPNDRVERHVAMLKDKLKLSGDQVTKIRAVLQDEQKQAQADRDKLKGDREAMRKAMTDRRKATDDKIKAVLTSDQKKQYDKVQDDLRKQVQDRREHRDRQGDRPGAKRGKQGW